MKSLIASAFALFLLTGAVFSINAQPAGKLDPSTLEAVPDGNYLVTLELNGKLERLNFEVKGNKAKCVNAGDASLKGIQVRFEAFDRQEGAFVARYSGTIGSQLWIFRKDGAAAVREIPDRGEQQSAVPVKGNTVELPKKP